MTLAERGRIAAWLAAVEASGTRTVVDVVGELQAENARLKVIVGKMELRHEQAEADVARIDASLLECAGEVERLRKAMEHPAYVAALRAAAGQ